MASQSDYPESWRSTGNRKVPHNLATGFFAKSKKSSGDVRSPTVQSPTLTMRGTTRALSDVSVSSTSIHTEQNDSKTEPISIPSSQPSSQYGTQKQKKLAPNTFNTHYRSISRSMNDLGNIFSRGRSPPNRDDYLKHATAAPGTNESSMKRTQEDPEAKSFESGSVPMISVVQHSDPISRDNVTREGWINVIDSHTLKKGLLKEAWKLHHALVSDNLLMLYKPPSSYQIRAFEIGCPATTPRPQSAPATASPSFNISSLRHKSISRHPELILGNGGSVEGGTVEALCHELMFTADTTFVEWAVRSLSGWTGPETALSVLIELCTLKDTSSRSTEVIRILAEATPGLLLEEGCYNCARLLVEKGIGSYNNKLAKASRSLLETRRASLQAALQLADSPDEPKIPRHNASGQLSSSLTADEFMALSPDVFAIQVHLFHLKYFQAWSPAVDISLLLVSPHLPPPSHRNPLVFNTASLHFLGERVLDHVLCGDSTTSIERRVTLLSQWIHVSQLLKIRGDMVGYLAITMAILSPPILRLRETWSMMNVNLVEDLEEKGGLAMRTLERRKLSYSGKPEGGLVFIPRGIGEDISSADAVPYFGDLLHCLDEGHASRGRTIDYLKMVQGLQNIADSIRRWKREWPSTDSRRMSSLEIDEPIQNCLEYLNSNNQNPPSSNATVFFDKSLACESSNTGMYLHSHYHQRLPLSTGANVPLIFTDIRASFSLFNRHDTLAISGSLHKKTPSSGLATPTVSTSGSYTANVQANQTLRPPTSHSQTQQPVLRRTRSFPPSKPSVQTTGYDELDFTTHERTAVLHGGDNAMLRAIRDVAGVGQQLFYSKDGELVLKSITDEAQSRPTSVIEITSKAQKPSSHRYSEITSNGPSPRVSMHGGESSVTACNETSLHECSSPFLLVVPKGGTLERLVDILVLGVEDFSKRMNRSDQGPNRDDIPLLKMDMDVFTITFFATFRSYCSPAVLIDYLKKRLVGSKSAATFSQNEGDDVVFPDWTGIDHVNDEGVDWSLVAKIHIGILDAVHIWISEFYTDFHSDQYLGESFISFLEIASKEILIWKSMVLGNPGLKRQAEDINGLWKNIKEKFKKLAFTPSRYDAVATSTSTMKLSLPLPKDVQSIAEFIESLDNSISSSFGAVKLVDWMLAFELLETQSAEPMGFFVPKVSLLSHEDDEAIQNIFFLLNNVRRRSSTSTLLESLPKSLRELCTMHMQLTNWILSRIVEHKISIEQRSERIASLLKALSICRQRMSGMDLYENSDVAMCRHVPSFVGSAIATALVRPESRMFNYAWQIAVKATGGTSTQIETLEQVIPTSVDCDFSTQPLTPCVGWMVERLLEIICHVPNMVVENNRLINFDKRRYVYNFVTNFTNHTSNKYQSSTSIFPIQIPEGLDARSLRETATKENQLSRHGRVKLFGKLLHQEQEKLRRDAKQRDAIERQQRQQLRAEHRRQPPGSKADVEKKSGKRLGVNSIFKAVRPISMALTGQWTPPQDTRRLVSPSELPPLKSLEHGRKPSAVIDLKSVSSISVSRGTLDRYIWRLTSDNGVGYWFQATSEKDLGHWLKCISDIRGIAASDGGESIEMLTVASHNRIGQKVFGVSLEELCKRDNVQVPVVVESLLLEIESRGLGEVGIYRVPGSLASINALREALDSGAQVRMDDDRWYDINVIAGVFKLFMRELPDQAQGLGPETLLELRNLTAEIPDEDDRVPAYREVILKLPPPNYHFLRRVYFHFAKISENQGANKMGAVNLAIVFGMGLSPSSSSPLGISPDLGLYQTMVKTWINFAHIIFPEISMELEVDHDTDDVHSISVITQIESTGTPSLGSVSPTLQKVSSFSPRMSLEEFRSVVDQGPLIK
ncbi:hypothetical protein EDC01DRAFT_669408 [Geopyxis carbonaria]|nr:hypothetical protein EDC01DRAFT_669408 [Geopyxis carbonaria]